MESSIITDIARAGNAAPSGHNTAPWRMVFEPHRAALSVYIVPGADTNPFNTNERGSYMAAGCLIENVRIAAAEHRFRADIRYFPRPSDTSHVADIMFFSDSLPGNDTTHRLYEAISRRTTNRKAYQRRPLQGEDRAALQDVRLPEGSDVGFVSNYPAMARVGQALAVPDRLLFENRLMHESVFHHLIWRKRDNECGKPGLYIKSLELPPPVQALFGPLMFWPIARALGMTGFGRLVARGNGTTYASASAFAIIGIQNHAPLSFVHAGEALERVWLTAEARGLSAHPLAGLFFLSIALQQGLSDRFDRNAMRRIEEAEHAIADVVQLRGMTPLVALRLGYQTRPSARAGRKPLIEVFEGAEHA